MLSVKYAVVMEKIGINAMGIEVVRVILLQH